VKAIAKSKPFFITENEKENSRRLRSRGKLVGSVGGGEVQPKSNPLKGKSGDKLRQKRKGSTTTKQRESTGVEKRA